MIQSSIRNMRSRNHVHAPLPKRCAPRAARIRLRITDSLDFCTSTMSGAIVDASGPVLAETCPTINTVESHSSQPNHLNQRRGPQLDHELFQVLTYAFDPVRSAFPRASTFHQGQTVATSLRGIWCSESVARGCERNKAGLLRAQKTSLPCDCPDTWR